MTTNKFIAKAQARYGDKFDYSRVDYVNSYTPVTILCPTHGEFQVRPNSFLHYKYGCPKCGHSEAGKKRSGVNNVAHGYTPYGATNEQHQERLKQLIQLSKDSSYYAQAIDVWTKRDVEKRQCAKDNKLNYVVFWDNDLADAKAWLLNWKLYH